MSITGEWAARVSITLLSRRAFIRMRVHLLPGPAEQIETLNKGFLLFPQVKNNQPLILSASSTLRGSKRSLVRWITYGERKKKKHWRENVLLFSQKAFLSDKKWPYPDSSQISRSGFPGHCYYVNRRSSLTCTGVYRHQLKVDTMTETRGGLDRLLSQHSKSSRIKK